MDLNQPTRRRELASSYIDHMVIALQSKDRAAPYRTFMDNWYAFKVGSLHLTKSDRPIWFNNPHIVARQKPLRAMHFLSRDAMALMDDAATAPKLYAERRSKRDRHIRMVIDHAVPIQVIVPRMIDQTSSLSIEATRETIVHILGDLYRLGVITSEEDGRLNKELRQRMPASWDGQDVFARYRAVGIEAAGA